jgi:hypothetical protein
MITQIRGRKFKWASFAVVEEVLRGILSKYEDFWIEEYNRQIKNEIFDKLATGEN